MNIGLKVKELLNTLESTKTHSEDGLITILLNTKELLVVNDFITSLIKLPIPILQKKRLISMYESVQASKKMIYKDNLSFYCLNIQLLELLKILAQDLTSNEKDYSSYWNCLIKDSLMKLSLPAKTDSVVSDMTLLNGTLHKQMSNSWFSIQQTNQKNLNLQKTYLPFYKSLLVDGTDQENILLKTKKIRLKLTPIQIKQLKKWKDDCRYSYNKAINIINEEHYTDIKLRNIITLSKTCSRIPWILETPKELRDGSVFEANKNKRAALTNLKNKNITHFNLRFLSSKQDTWTINGLTSIKKINNRTIHLFPKYNFGKVKTYETLPENFGKVNSNSNKFLTCKLHFDGLYYFILVPVETTCKKILNKNPTCSIDPGERTAHTIYDGFNECCYKIGEDASNKIYLNLLTLDNLISKKSKLKKSKSNVINKKIIKLKKRIKNLQKEMHDKTINWLTTNYNRIVIPKFDSKSMSNKKSRRISTKTVRGMSSLAHGLFLEKLKTKAIENSSKIIIIDEMYTTMTCGKCFYKNKNIKSKSEWVCPKCNWYHDRDTNASRNMLIMKEFEEVW